MGGPGSGRWYRGDTKATVEGCRHLDVRDWQRRGLLCPHTEFSWGWWNGDGRKVASITVRVQPGGVRLSYCIQRRGEDWQDIEEPVALVWTPCYYGGHRPWFICPGVVQGRICGRRVAILYGAGRYFLCRHCYDLTYESQREDLPTRLISKAQKIRRRLGGSASSVEPFPAKPKGMHWHTYDRLRWQAREAKISSMLAAVARLEGLRARSRISALSGEVQGGIIADGPHKTPHNLTSRSRLRTRPLRRRFPPC